MHDLNGKIGLVTGAAAGIGRETAKELARCGAKVVATDHDTSMLREAAGEFASERLDVEVLSLDVTAPSDWSEALEHVDQVYGALNLLVNNAGIMLSKSFMDTTLQDFRQTMSVNLESVVLGAKVAFPLLERTARSCAAGTSIVNVSSIFGLVAGDQYSAYCASKAAVRLLTKCLAVEFGPAGIRVNSVHPGGVNTALGRSGLEEAVHKGVFADLSAALAAVGRITPLGRMAEVSDIAGVIAFMGSDASRFMTGSEVVVDGGVTAT